MTGQLSVEINTPLEAISLSDAEQPAGGAHVSVQDVYRFADSMRQRGNSGDYRVISPALFDYAARNHTGDMLNGATEFIVEAEGREPQRANFSLLGGYARGEGHFL